MAELYKSNEVGLALRRAAFAEAISQQSYVRRLVVRDLMARGFLRPDAPITPGRARMRQDFRGEML
jgi:hypothetical protein